MNEKEATQENEEIDLATQKILESILIITPILPINAFQ